VVSEVLWDLRRSFLDHLLEADVWTSSNPEVKTTESEKPKSGLGDTQLNSWLYETERDKLTMSEIFEQQKGEAVGNEPKKDTGH
jgi:hypothetical protein